MVAMWETRIHQLTFVPQEFPMTTSQCSKIKAMANLEFAFGGESMTHIK